MKSSRLLSLLFCFIVAQSCSQSGNSDKVDQKTIDEVTELLTQYSINWADAIKEKDASKVAEYFASDIVFHEATGKRTYRDELLKQINENPNTIRSFVTKDIQVNLFGPDLANVTLGGVNTYTDPSGMEQTFEGRFTNVWRKNSGKWQCIVGHGSPLQYSNPETDLSKIKAIPALAAEAINSNNFQAWLDFFDEEAQVMFFGTKTLNGKEEMNRELRKLWENVKSEYSINHTETKLIGDFAYGIGTITGQEKNLKTGQVEKINSRELVIFKKQNNGEWKTFRLIVNQNK